MKITNAIRIHLCRVAFRSCHHPSFCHCYPRQYCMHVHLRAIAIDVKRRENRVGAIVAFRPHHLLWRRRIQRSLCGSVRSPTQVFESPIGDRDAIAFRVLSAKALSIPSDMHANSKLTATQTCSVVRSTL